MRVFSVRDDVPVPSSAFARRLALLAGMGGAVLLASWLSRAVEPTADAELTRLLQGMAFIKFGLVLMAMAGIGWRLGLPTSNRLAAVYLSCAWVATVATTLLWRLAFIPAASVAFHAAELTFLFVAWKDLSSTPSRP